MNEPGGDPIDNRKIYDGSWNDWADMKRHGPASRWLRSLILDMLRADAFDPAAVSTALDVGCGEGTNTQAIAHALPHAHVTGIDFSITGIETARIHNAAPNLAFELDTESTRLEQSYDLVCAFEVLEHIPDWQPFLDRIARAARRYVLLSFPTGRMRAFEKAVGHCRNFQRGEVETRLRENHFAPAKISYAGFPFYSPLYRDFCNLTQSGSNAFTRGTYDWKQKAVAKTLYQLFRHASTRHNHGDQFCGLFERVK